MLSKTNPLYIKSDKLAMEIYEVARSFPKDELYGLTSQIRRAALSVMLNIVEGFARQGQNEYRRFLIIAFGSLKETKYLIDFAYRQKYLREDRVKILASLAEEVARILWTIINKPT